jgi:transposase
LKQQLLAVLEAIEEGKDIEDLLPPELEVAHPNAAGIDVGAEEMYVAVPTGRAGENVQKFGTFTEDLNAIADWLESCGVDTVAMESTGVYWVPLYEILEARGFEVYLVNALHMKNVPGRKSDVIDSQWLQKLHSYGLLSASFRPEADIVTLRELSRYRGKLVQFRGTQIQHMQKALELMNLKLKNVISDITGVTGQQIIRAIAAGERDPEKLAQFRDTRCKSSEATIAKSLHGHYKEEQVFLLTEALSSFDHFSAQIDRIDTKIEVTLSQFESVVDSADIPLPKRRTHKSKNAPDFDLRTDLYEMCGVDLTAIPGIKGLTALIILSGIGRDMSKWKTDKHFASWLCLAPRNKISGGKVLSSRIIRSNNRVTTALKQAAVRAGKTDTALGAFYRRIKARSGPLTAAAATARKMAVIIYHMLTKGQEFVDLGAGHYEEKHKARMLKNMKKKAERMGFELVSVE